MLLIHIFETVMFIKSVKKQGDRNLDQRGTGTSNAYYDETIDMIKEHINSFQAYESHYTRKECTKVSRTRSKFICNVLLILRKIYSKQNIVSKGVSFNEFKA